MCIRIFSNLNLNNVIYHTNDSFSEHRLYALWLFHPTVSIKLDRSSSDNHLELDIS